MTMTNLLYKMKFDSDVQFSGLGPGQHSFKTASITISPYHTINVLQSEIHLTSNEVRVRTLQDGFSKNIFQKC